VLIAEQSQRTLIEVGQGVRFRQGPEHSRLHEATHINVEMRQLDCQVGSNQQDQPRIRQEEISIRIFSALDLIPERTIEEIQTGLGSTSNLRDRVLHQETMDNKQVLPIIDRTISRRLLQGIIQNLQEAQNLRKG